jgi:aldehyde:ferredoxin oxidoreductase
LDGSELRWGDSAAIVQLVEKIAFREGIGDTLANGIKLAAETFGPQAQDIALHTKGMDLPAHEPRAESTLLGVQYAVSPKGACHMHPNNIAIYDEAHWDPGLKPFGRPWPPAPIHAEVGFKKGVLYRLVSLQGEISEILGCCIFHSWGSEDRCLTPQLYREMFRTLTGIDMSVEELMSAAERSWNLKRCFNLREGFLRKDDNLPRRMFQPLPDGPAKGEHFKNLDGMLDEYYDAFGWDRNTGGPKFETLLKLDMEDIAKTLFAG